MRRAKTSLRTLRSLRWIVVKAARKLREMSPLYEMHKEGVDLKTVQWAAH